MANHQYLSRPVRLSIKLEDGSAKVSVQGLTKGMILDALRQIEQAGGKTARMEATNNDVMRLVFKNANGRLSFDYTPRKGGATLRLRDELTRNKVLGTNFDAPSPHLEGLQNEILELKYYHDHRSKPVIT